MTISALNKLFQNTRSIISNGKPVTIIRYHSISDEYDSYTVSPKKFRLQLEYIAKNYSIIRLKDLKSALSVTSNNQKKVVITFDDAFADFYDIAYPIMEELAIPSTMFIPTGLIGKYNIWDANMDGYVKRRIMTHQQCIELKQQGLVDFGSHSVNHKSMNKLPADEMIKEAVDSRRALEEMMEYPVTMFSYPFGHHSDTTTKILSQAGYELAITSRWGTLNSEKKILRLKRIVFKESDDYNDIKEKIEGHRDLEICYTRRMNSKLHSIMRK